MNKYEGFYTKAKSRKRERVDMIEINSNKKLYRFYEEINEASTDGWDEYDREIYTYYVNREFFEFLLSAVKLQGYKKVNEWWDLGI